MVDQNSGSSFVCLYLNLCFTACMEDARSVTVNEMTQDTLWLYRQEPHVHEVCLSTCDVAQISHSLWQWRHRGGTQTRALYGRGSPDTDHRTPFMTLATKRICMTTGKTLAALKSFKRKHSWWWMWQCLWLAASSLDLKHKPSSAGFVHPSVSSSHRHVGPCWGLVCVEHICPHLASPFYQQTHYPNKLPLNWGALFAFPSTSLVQWIYIISNTWTKMKIKKQSLNLSC